MSDDDLRSTGVCDPLLVGLKDCLMRSDCVLKQNRLPSDCLKNHHEELPLPCQHLRQALFDCKRGKLDMRKRFRGHSTAGAKVPLPPAPDASSTPPTAGFGSTSAPGTTSNLPDVQVNGVDDRKIFKSS